MSWLAEKPHRRRNLLTGEWVLVSPHRAKRPWQGQMDQAQIPGAQSYDPACYLCPGNERAGGIRNPDYRSTFVFDNDFAALLPDDSHSRQEGLLEAESAGGLCRVVCFSPDHSLTIAKLSEEAMRAVIGTWCAQSADLFDRPDIVSVQAFENRGAMMGASNPHPHGQIWATDFVPPELARECDRQEETPGLLPLYLAEELSLQTRVVAENESWVTMVPFWAVWPFETLVLPRRSVPRLTELSNGERDGLGDMLRRVTSIYDRLFQVPFPYTMGFHQAPKGREQDFHVHAHFYPPLLRSAEVRKFMVGFEMLAMPQRDITPETAAERLRMVAAASPG